jgi:hypothetical protein
MGRIWGAHACVCVCVERVLVCVTCVWNYVVCLFVSFCVRRVQCARRCVRVWVFHAQGVALGSERMGAVRRPHATLRTLGKRDRTRGPRHPTRSSLSPGAISSKTSRAHVRTHTHTLTHRHSHTHTHMFPHTNTHILLVHTTNTRIPPHLHQPEPCCIAKVHQLLQIQKLTHTQGVLGLGGREQRLVGGVRSVFEGG